VGVGLDVDVRAGKGGQNEDERKEKTQLFHGFLLFCEFMLRIENLYYNEKARRGQNPIDGQPFN
jgi:hypothetical protein